MMKDVVQRKLNLEFTKVNWLRLEEAIYKRNADSFAGRNSSIDLLFNEKYHISA